MSGVEHVIPNPMQPLIVTSINRRILAFAILSTAAGWILAATYPAWRARGANAQELLRDTGSNAKGLRRRGRTLLIVESGIGTVLVLAAALAIRSFVALNLNRPGLLAGWAVHLDDYGATRKHG